MRNKNILEIYQHLEQDLAALIGKVKFDPKVNLKLERIEHLLELLGSPENDYAIIHIGGTSGKGSTATMVSSILVEAGYRTGLHISPHLQILNERHQINNQVAPTRRLAELYARMQPLIEQVGRDNAQGKPSYFEAQVALALYYFSVEQVDVAVIEVGLGGTLDGTNVVPARVAVLTNVGLDHVEILGRQIELIAKDKAGIIKPGQTVVSGFLQPSAQAIVTERCKEQDARLWQINREFGYVHDISNASFSVETPVQRLAGLSVGMPGAFQMANAAGAIAAVHALADFPVSESAIRKGLQNARIPGRMEIVQEQPTVLLDGAHNPDKMQGAAQWIARLPRQRQIVVLSLKSDKDFDEILPPVLQHTDVFIITAFRIKGLWEPMPPEQIYQAARKIHPDLSIEMIPDPLQAIATALKIADPKDLIWVTGSLYLIGDIREHWYPIAKLIEQAEEGLSGALTY